MSIHTADALLEEWAAWRIETLEMTGQSTGASSITRLNLYSGVYQCRPLWTGDIRPTLSALNGRLNNAMTTEHVTLLIMSYGMTTGAFRKAIGGSPSDRTIRRIKGKARAIAENLVLLPVHQP